MRRVDAVLGLVMRRGFVEIAREAAPYERGIAEALKRTQLAWAAAAGYGQLVTYTQEGNDAMRTLNLKLGYRERLASISVRGRLATSASDV